MRIRSRHRGFTLVELLMVIAMILILISILVPAITRIRTVERAVACESNVRVLMQGIIAFAADNDNRLPGNQGSIGSPIPSQRDFLFGSSAGSSSTIGLAPQSGTLFPYVGNNYLVYLCPSLQADIGGGGSGTASFASNGRFDYALFGVWTGARLQTIAPTSVMTMPNGTTQTLPTPVLVQEQGNEVDGPNMEGCHSNVDLISHVHSGGSYYGAVDGSIQFVNESAGSPAGIGCWCWTSRGPSSQQMRSMQGSNPNPPWGFWDSQ